ncbi:hypothetical protein E8E15_003868 [Penicillium rubens]|nr:hypothetical protein E8E15_003868 [Penicillium rubens]
MPADRGTRVQSSVAYTKVWPGSLAAEKKLNREELQRRGSLSTMKVMEKGDPLPKFVAKVYCLLWFEEISTLQAVEDCQFSVPRRIGKVIPTPGFQQWVATILSIMQVSENVIFLALGLMYRLKSSNWKIGGQNQ